MAEIRLNKIIRQFNIGLDDLVNFLQKIGVELDANPNAKIDESYMPAISKQFGKDLEIKQAADKVDIKIKEIIEKGRKQPKRKLKMIRNTRQSSKAILFPATNHLR